MSTCRRRLLDKALEEAVGIMRRHVLDIGGKKDNKRGTFRPPLDKVSAWEYVNISAEANPDYCCDASSSPLGDGSIDTVVMTEVLEYLEEPEKVLGEIYRLLVNNGTFIMSVPFLHPVHGDWQCDRQRWTALKLEEVCLRLGFKDVEIQPMGSFWSVLHDILHVRFGYSHPRSGWIHVRIFRSILHICTSFFLWLDSGSGVEKKYINTGYFVVMKKN